MRYVSDDLLIEIRSLANYSSLRHVGSAIESEEMTSEDPMSTTTMKTTTPSMGKLEIETVLMPGQLVVE
jgi:hypothetical protein